MRCSSLQDWQITGSRHVLTSPEQFTEITSRLRDYANRLHQIADLTDDPVIQIYTYEESRMFNLVADRLDHAYDSLGLLLGVLEHITSRPFFNYQDNDGGISQFGWVAAVHCETFTYLKQLVRFARDNGYPVEHYTAPRTGGR